MHMSGKYELLIFDWDGTLADSEAMIVGSMQQAISELQLPSRSHRDIAELIGLGLDDAFARLFPEYTQAQRNALIAAYGQHYRQRQHPPALMFQGVEATLQQLRSAGWQLAIATGKSRHGLERALRESGMAAYFAQTRCADETANKPAPDMLDALLLATATLPEAALMIGDTEFDMAMAVNAGVDAIAVGCGVHDDARLLASGAMAVLDDVTQLPAWLANSAAS